MLVEMKVALNASIVIPGPRSGARNPDPLALQENELPRPAPFCIA
ncbi:hypothetical protein [Methylobacterium variabile]|jgi:hypothetical protein|nr:hypothetical protein [Methylobacterium variabile]